jgi:anti-anti-sigma factor
MSDLKVSSREKSPRIFEVSLDGRLDTRTAPRLEAMLEILLGSRPRAIQLNMSGLDYISSVGLAVVLKTAKRMKDLDGRFALSNPRPHIKKVFDVAGLLPTQKVFATVAEADRYFDAIQRREKDKQGCD